MDYNTYTILYYSLLNQSQNPNPIIIITQPQNIHPMNKQPQPNLSPLTPLSVTQTKLLKNIILRMKIQRMLKIWKKQIKKSKHRINILKQWEATQQAYIKDLTLIIQKIQKPLLEKGLITGEEDRVMFPNLDAMLKLSRELLAEIKKFLANWNPHKTVIGNTLINFHKYFIIYREYCNNFYKAQKILKSLTPNPSLQSITSTLPMDLQSYIIKPVQRPPKYQLLLRQYQKSLPKSHTDFEPLKIAIEKYHAVNEQNNQSMDLQIRNEKMVELDKLYGGVIGLARVYLFQEYMKSIEVEGRLKMYAFNDMLMIVKVMGQEKEKEKQEGYKKIFLDGQSFVQAPMDGKYLINKLFICGTKDNLHCTFINEATRDRIYEKLTKIIHELYRKQTQRTKNNVKNKTKMNVMKMQELDIKGRPKLRITVVGVEKRPQNLINLNINLNLSFQTYYILKITAPFPSPIFQYTYLRFSQLISLQQYLRTKNKMLLIPSLDDKPQQMNIYDVKKNKTKIIECRELYIQRFVNFVFRSQELEGCAEEIAKKLKINQELWEFVRNVEPCCCEICTEQKQSISLYELEEQKQQIKSVITSFLPLKSNTSFSSTHTSQQPPSYQPSLWSSLASRCSTTSICLYNSITMATKLSETPTQQLNTLARRLTWLECKLGRIDYSLIPRNDIENNIKISISFLSLKQDQNINVRIGKGMTVLEVIDKVADMYKIQTMRDFGLFVEFQGVTRMLDRDEKLWEVLNDIQYEFQQVEPDKEESSIWRKINSIKKWGSQIILGKKQKISIRKYIFINQQLQLKACQQNPQRYSILVEQIFYRYHHELLILNAVDSRRLCALYYICNYMDKLAHLSEGNFQIEKIRGLLSEARWHIVSNSEEFQRDVYNYIKEYEQLMEEMPLPISRRSNTPSNIFSAIEVIHNLTLKLVHRVPGYNTLYFQVTNYDPPSLPGSCSSLLLGISRKYFTIIRHKQLQPLLQIELKKLEYKCTKQKNEYQDLMDRLCMMLKKWQKFIDLWETNLEIFDIYRNRRSEKF